MENLLQGIPNIVIIYLDDILIMGKTESYHFSTLAKVLTKLEQAGLQVHESKCKFMAESVAFLGHVINKQGIRPIKKKVCAIQEAPIPQNVPEPKLREDDSDRYNGPCFVSEEFETFTLNNGIQHITLTTLPPMGWQKEQYKLFKKDLKRRRQVQWKHDWQSIDGLSNNSAKYHRCDTSRVTARQTYQNKTGYLETKFVSTGRATTVPSEEWS